MYSGGFWDFFWFAGEKKVAETPFFIRKLGMKAIKLAFILPLLAPSLFLSPIQADASVGSYDTDPLTYYEDITADSGIELLGELHDLITTTHKTYTTYDDCKTPEYVAKTDSDGGGDVMEFYSQSSIDKAWGKGSQGTWNREHVWCKSLSNNVWNESYGGSDMHHIRPVESGLNSARNNSPYGEVVCSSANALYYENSNNDPVALGGHKENDVFEPLDNVKGDVARIIFYLYTHYNDYSNVGGTTNGSGGKFGDLDFSLIVDGSEEQAIETLLAWNELDPVSQQEEDRNEAVASYQGNRNPFIDHPEYADYIWGDASPSPSFSCPSELKLTLGQTKSIEYSYSGELESLSFVSLDPDVVEVDGEGTVTALSVGEVTIEVEALVSGVLFEEIIQVSVTAESAASGAYRLLTSIPEQIDGEYVIAYGEKALNASLEEGLDVGSNYVVIAIDGNEITSDVSAISLRFESRDGGFDIITPDGNFVYWGSSDDNGLSVASSASASSLNYFSADPDGIGIKGGGGARMRFNNASNQLRFRYYMEKTYVNQKPIKIYKLEEGDGLNEAISFASAFLTTVTCDGGLTPPSESAWAAMGEKYESISASAKAHLSSAADEKIILFLERYDYIISKYGTDAYPDFLGRGGNRAGRIGGGGADAIVPIAAVSFSFLALGSLLFLLYRKKEGR